MVVSVFLLTEGLYFNGFLFSVRVSGVSNCSLEEGFISIDCILLSWLIDPRSFEFSIELLSNIGLLPSVFASSSDFLELGCSQPLDPSCSSGKSTRGCMSGLLKTFFTFGLAAASIVDADDFLRDSWRLDDGNYFTVPFAICFLPDWEEPEAAADFDVPADVALGNYCAPWGLRGSFFVSSSGPPPVFGYF